MRIYGKSGAPLHADIASGVEDLKAAAESLPAERRGRQKSHFLGDPPPSLRARRLLRLVPHRVADSAGGSRLTYKGARMRRH